MICELEDVVLNLLSNMDRVNEKLVNGTHEMWEKSLRASFSIG